MLKRFRSILRRNTIYRSYTRQLGMADREQLIGFLELTKFIDQCNEIKAANLASKEGGDLNIVKADGDQSKSKK